ncbi:sugar ABC transporter substrate-binding protein [Alicyclobacillus cellulosilyticus]|uniref:Sugar ABC transporter substrate-binding protein n=1 Tax=Alicyclobacillus cellulosilyticus TaxID=1003997 RepID=A0A917NLY9_9BACL|nr:extracellular solute-binding protein [Alicyclobacillus cellulosilyticus]GGJ10725.1 sugar ABC transporter substrate-binding protein [Alicyclobacillus cellulosilyticus]
MKKSLWMSAGATALLSASVLAGCNLSAGAAQKVNITLWDIQTGQVQQVIKQMIDRFNQSHPDIHVQPQWFQNGPYKQKILIAMGAHNPPDIFMGWGGGILKSYIDAGDVYDLTSDINKDPQWKNRFLPSVMKPVTFNGHIYGVPYTGVQPVYFFYNKQLFQKYHVAIPKTWNQLLNAIKVFNKNGVIPITLGGKDLWPNLMYEEYLVDRIGGPEAFNAVLAGKKNAWSNPAFIKANTMIQQLVKMKAFEPGFSSVSYDNAASTSLLFTGRAAMELMGSWEFNTVYSNNKAMIDQGNLGWFPFPSVPGGKGNPNDIAGNPSGYYSISKASKNPQAAVTFLRDAVLTGQNVKDWINIGNVPPVKGIEKDLKQAKFGDFLTFNYDLVKNAPNFQMSWDQALSPAQAQELLTDLGKLFLLQMTPQQFSADMNKYIGK